MIINPENIQSGIPVFVRRGGGSHAHIQFQLDEHVNRGYGACYDVPTTNELGAFLGAVAEGASYDGAKSLASNATNYLAGTLHQYDDGVVFQAEVASVPLFARPFLNDNGIRVGFSSDVVPAEILDLF